MGKKGNWFYAVKKALSSESKQKREKVDECVYDIIKRQEIIIEHFVFVDHRKQVNHKDVSGNKRIKNWMMIYIQNLHY